MRAINELTMSYPEKRKQTTSMIKFMYKRTDSNKNHFVGTSISHAVINIHCDISISLKTISVYMEYLEHGFCTGLQIFYPSGKFMVKS